MTYFLLCVGLALLVYGGNLLVDGAVELAKRLGLSSLIIGLVLVGFGTSVPELIASLISAIRGAEGIAVGNVVGSNIANILLVLGTAALLHPVSIDINAFKRDGIMLIIATGFLFTGGLWGVIDHLTGALFVASLIGYIIYSYHTDKKTHPEPIEENASSVKAVNGFWAFGKTVIGIGLTVGGAKLLVDNAIILARNWGVSESVIGLTVVAVGTSLPELTASVVASLKKENGVAFGNVVGSNIYNALFILGAVALIVPIRIPEGMMPDMIAMAAATLALCLIAVWQKRFSRPIGALFLIAYGVYIWGLF